jgi:hypothetical protein
LANERKSKKRPKYKYNKRKHSVNSIQTTAVIGISHVIRKVRQCETVYLSGGDSWRLKRGAGGERSFVTGDNKKYNDNNNNNNNNIIQKMIYIS